MGITYTSRRDLDLDQVIGLYHASTLGERRPVADRHVMQGMMDNADVIVTAWDGETLVGISRTLTDFTYVAYLADLAVHVDWQGRGIGTELIEQTRRMLEPTWKSCTQGASARQAVM
jgi:predicted N-acetyltransferase YhbS